MLWIVALGAVIAAFSFPRFGKALLILVAVGIAIVLVLDRQSEQEHERSKHLVSTAELDISDLRLASGIGDSVKLVGRITNKSDRYTLEEVVFQITLKDCAPDGSCDTIGESTATFDDSVPPNQTRGIDSHVSFSNIPELRGQVRREVRVLEIHAR